MSFFLLKPQTGGRVCSTVARLSTEPTATVAWQLSRASGRAKWTDTHKKTCVETSVHGRAQVLTEQQTAECVD